MSQSPYFEHDDRLSNRSMGRNRKFYARTNRGNFSGNTRARVDVNLDQDAEMNGPARSTERRFVPYYSQRRNRGNIKNNNRNRTKPVREEDGSWYKFSVSFGKKLGKEFILKAIASQCKVPFTPFNFHFEGNNAFFYVNDQHAAFRIRDMNRRITTPDGFKMLICMTRSPTPSYAIVFDEEVTERIKVCMSNHYDVATHSLDLKRFHLDPHLKMGGLFVPLSRPNIMKTVLQIIGEHIPELECLDVSENRLFSLEPFSAITNVCKQLKSLSLANNRLRSVQEINSLKGLSIMDLNLDGNPLCDDFKDKGNYINAVRQRFPKLLKLDGHELPAPIVFDLETNETLPPSKGSFFIADDVKGLVIQFLEQYYMIYDSDDRGKLLEAYHDQANFSVSVLRQQQRHKDGALQTYIQEDRNLTRVHEPNFRYKLLKQGKLAVVSALTQLPQTQHDPNSFTIDIFHVSPGLMTFTVNGVFKEVAHNMSNQPLLAFHRTFLVVAQGSGFVIVNEMLFVANATPEQNKAFKFPAPTPSPSPAPSTSSIGDKSPSEKHQMAMEFSKLSEMNLEFSAKCLEENDWDYQKSAMIFTELKSLGKIPPEAFVHH